MVEGDKGCTKCPESALPQTKGFVKCERMELRSKEDGIDRINPEGF